MPSKTIERFEDVSTAIYHLGQLVNSLLSTRHPDGVKLEMVMGEMTDILEEMDKVYDALPDETDDDATITNEPSDN
jgi:hypothetical protein